MSAPTSLTTRVTLATALVAAIAVLVTGLVSWPIIADASQAQARETLGRQADLVADVVGRTEAGDALGGLVRFRQVLTAQGIQVQVVRPRRPPVPPVTAADVAITSSGGSVSDVRDGGDGRVLVEGRQVSATTSVFLVQDAAVARSQAGLALRRLLLALTVGLAVAVLVGWLAARRIVRPLRRAADAAERMATGARDVALPAEGPAEVVTMSESLTRLSAALAHSEGRQRDFLLSVSHELRTPLTGITGYAEALADGVIPPEGVAATGAVVRREAERLERLVADLLDLARLGASDLRLSVVDVDLAEVVRQASTVWASRCERAGVLLRVEVPPGPVPARTDPGRARQIIDNLAENALRLTPAGAPLVLAARVGPGSTAVLEVRDGGPGLTPDDVAVAFEPAVLHERYREVRPAGTGVGLALVGRLAARLGGSAAAGSAPEGGARFTVTLPGPT